MIRFALKIGSKRLGWIYRNKQADFDLLHMLPFTGLEYERLPDDAPVDFLTLVSWNPSDPLPQEFADFKGMRFILCGEPNWHYPQLDNCWQFVNGGDDRNPMERFAPCLSYWVPPMTASNKTHKCSLIDSGNYPDRLAKMSAAAEVIGDVERFGKHCGNVLGGYFGEQPQLKHQGLVPYAFTLAVESQSLPDYWSEKIGDAFLCECIPIYSGCPNITEYFHPYSFIRLEDVKTIDWKNWYGEYYARRDMVWIQKKIILQKYNVFSYINSITDKTELLDKKRPITLWGN